MASGSAPAITSPPTALCTNPAIPSIPYLPHHTHPTIPTLTSYPQPQPPKDASTSPMSLSDSMPLFDPRYQLFPSDPLTLLLPPLPLLQLPMLFPLLLLASLAMARELTPRISHDSLLRCPSALYWCHSPVGQEADGGVPAEERGAPGPRPSSAQVLPPALITILTTTTN